MLRGGTSFKSQGDRRSRGAPLKKAAQEKRDAATAARTAPQAFASHASAQLTEEELNALRNARKIRVSGADVPSLLPDLASLAALPGCPSQLLANMAALGWTDLTDTQMQSIPALLDDRDILSCAPTGSGKTGAFAIPLIVRLLRNEPRAGTERSPRAVILAPTRELAAQIARETARLAKNTGIAVYALVKDDLDHGPERRAQVLADCDVLVSTPLRLVGLLEKTKTSAAWRLDAVETMVVSVTPNHTDTQPTETHATQDIYDDYLPILRTP